MENTTTLIAVGLGIGAGYLFLKSQNQNTQFNTYPNFPTISSQPRPNTPEWAIWANAIIASFGNVAALWAPGGPFYNNPNVTNQGFDVNIDPREFGGFV